MTRIEALVIGIVTILSLVQIPLDVRTRELSRKATVIAIIGVLSALGVETVSSGSARWLIRAVVIAALVGVSYLVLHLLSPHAMGFGDVLLVIPLTLAVAYRGVEPVLYWQLVAACTGALHALALQVRRQQSSIPFGPHLILSALVVLIASL